MTSTVPRTLSTELSARTAMTRTSHSSSCRSGARGPAVICSVIRSSTTAVDAVATLIALARSGTRHRVGIRRTRQMYPQGGRCCQPRLRRERDRGAGGATQALLEAWKLARRVFGRSGATELISDARGEGRLSPACMAGFTTKGPSRVLRANKSSRVARTTRSGVPSLAAAPHRLCLP